MSARRRAKHCCSWPSRLANITIRRSSSSFGAARRRNKRWLPPFWNVQGRRNAPDRKSCVSESAGSLLLAGAGRMGAALLHGWIARKPGYRILVVEPNPSDVVKDWARAGTIELCSAVDSSKLPPMQAIVLALKPQVIKTERALLQELGAAKAPVISIAAGITTHWLSTVLGRGARVVR